MDVKTKRAVKSYTASARLSSTTTTTPSLLCRLFLFYVELFSPFIPQFSIPFQVAYFLVRLVCVEPDKLQVLVL